jgi:hypothetical protein
VLRAGAQQTLTLDRRPRLGYEPKRSVLRPHVKEYARRYTADVVSRLVKQANDKRLSDWDRTFLQDLEGRISRFHGLFLSDRQSLCVLRIEDKLADRPPVETLAIEEGELDDRVRVES